MTTAMHFPQRFLQPSRGPVNRHNAMAAARRDPRLQAVEWKDLVPLSRAETLWELSLVWPWLGLSLALAAWQEWPAALGCSFMVFLTGLRQSHNAQHHALGLGKAVTTAVLFTLSIIMLGSMHAVRFNHLRHHKHCLTPDDAEGVSARMSGWQALAFGPIFPLLLHWTALRRGDPRTRRWVTAELAANAVWIAAVFAWLDHDWLRYHVTVMAVGQCLTAFFAVWTVHNHCEELAFPARTQRHRLLNRLSYSMFFHVEHHLFPKVPTCHLPVLAGRLDAVVPELRENLVL